MSDILPIAWSDKVNSPQLLAFLQQFGTEHYLSAEEINLFRDGINELFEDLGTKTSKGGYTGTAQDLKTLIDGINTILSSDNVDLDHVQELVDAIETIQTSLSTILVNDLTTGGVTKALTAEQGKVLKDAIDGINAILSSDNVNLDHVQELVDAIETIQTSLSTILVNDLTTGGTTKALTAQQGVVLKGLIDGINTLLASDNVNLDNVQELVDAIETIQLSLSTILVNDLTTGGTTKALTAQQGVVLKGFIDTLTTGLATVTGWGNHALAGYLTSSKTYKTYFINTATGNNATGVFEDSTKPFATIDYVNANFTITDGDIFYLQGTGQTYAINGQLQNVSQSFISNDISTNILDFSGNSNTYITPTSATVNVFTIKMLSGTIRCERSGGTGVIFMNYGYGATLNVHVRDIYWNTSTIMSQAGGATNFVRVNRKVTCRTSLLQTLQEDVFIPEFSCLANGATYTTGYDALSAIHTIKINKISGAGSYTFYSGHNYIIGNISTTGVCSPANSTSELFTKIEFNNSVITGGGFQIPAYGIGLVLSGVIKSVSSFSNLTGGGNGILKFVGFTADIGGNSIKLEGTGKIISFENCSIKSTNSPLGVFTNTGTGTFIVKNSAFEVVNAVPLMTGGAGGTRTLTIAGVSTNATMLSDQNGTGVTVTQFTNY